MLMLNFYTFVCFGECNFLKLIKFFQYSNLTCELFAPSESGNYIHIPGETCHEKNGLAYSTSYRHCVQGALLCTYMLRGEMKKEMTPKRYEVTLFNEYWKALKGYSNWHDSRIQLVLDRVKNCS